MWEKISKFMKWRIVALFIAKWAWIPTSVWLVCELTAGIFPAVISWPPAGVATALGSLLTALVATSAEFSSDDARKELENARKELEKLASYFVQFLPDWPAVETCIIKMLKEIEDDNGSSFWLAAYWFGFGADGHEWDCSKCPVPQEILSRIPKNKESLPRTCLILMHPDDGDFQRFLVALHDRVLPNGSSTNAVNADTVRQKYKEWLFHEWKAKAQEPKGKNETEVWTERKWAATLDPNESKVRLMFTEDELPLLVALAKSSKGTTKAVIMLGNTGALREGGPVGGFATEDHRLATQVENMLEQLIKEKKDKPLDLSAPNQAPKVTEQNA